MRTVGLDVPAEVKEQEQTHENAPAPVTEKLTEQRKPGRPKKSAT